MSNRNKICIQWIFLRMQWTGFCFDFSSSNSVLTSISIRSGKSLTTVRIAPSRVSIPTNYAMLSACVTYVLFPAAIVRRWARFSEAPYIGEFHPRFIIVLIVTKVKRRVNYINIVNSQYACVQINGKLMLAVN